MHFGIKRTCHCPKAGAKYQREPLGVWRLVLIDVALERDCVLTNGLVAPLDVCSCAEANVCVQWQRVRYMLLLLFSSDCTLNLDASIGLLRQCVTAKEQVALPLTNSDGRPT